MAEPETRRIPTPEDVSFAALEVAIRGNFEQRVAAARARCADLLSHPASRDVFAALLDLDEGERHGLLRHVVTDISGPGTIGGLEALTGFVSYYVLDDGEVMIVDDVDPEIEEVGFAAIMANHRALADDPASVPHEALEDWRNRERSRTLVFSDESRPVARGAGIIDVIRFNRDFAAREQAATDAAYEAFMNDDEEQTSPGPRA